MSHKSDPQECPTRVSHKSVLQERHLDICSFSNVFAFGFVGSILFFFQGLVDCYYSFTVKVDTPKEILLYQGSV